MDLPSPGILLGAQKTGIKQLLKVWCGVVCMLCHSEVRKYELQGHKLSGAVASIHHVEHGSVDCFLPFYRTLVATKSDRALQNRLIRVKTPKPRRSGVPVAVSGVCMGSVANQLSRLDCCGKQCCNTCKSDLYNKILKDILIKMNLDSMRLIVLLLTSCSKTDARFTTHTS